MHRSTEPEPLPQPQIDPRAERGGRILDRLALLAMVFAAGWVIGDRRSTIPPKPGQLHAAAAHAEGGGAIGRTRGLERGRGRTARTPGEIPGRGWKDVLWRVWKGLDDDRVLAVAAGVTFYMLLALFPGIATLVSVYGFFADVGTMREHLDTMAGVLPSGAIDVIGEQMNRLAGKSQGTLGFASLFGLALALWSANSGMKALFDALNVVYKEREKRGFFRLNLVSLTFTLGAILFMLVSLAAVVAVPIVLNYFQFNTTNQTLIGVLRWPILLLLIMAALAILYRYGPSREVPKLHWATWGSVAAALLWLAVSMLFSWYVKDFGSYDQTYGSLGAVIGFMTWIWISTIVVLLGGELNAEMEHQTAIDTTTGQPRPLGARGATVADTVGAKA